MSKDFASYMRGLRLLDKRLAALLGWRVEREAREQDGVVRYVLIEPCLVEYESSGREDLAWNNVPLWSRRADLALGLLLEVCLDHDWCWSLEGPSRYEPLPVGRDEEHSGRFVTCRILRGRRTKKRIAIESAPTVESAIVKALITALETSLNIGERSVSPHTGRQE